MAASGASGEPTRLMKPTGEREIQRYMSLLADWRSPSGSVVLFPDAIDPDGQNWLYCDGGTIGEKQYPRLVGLLGSTTLPDFTASEPSGAKYYIKT